VNDLIHVGRAGEQEMAECLDPGQTNPAYLCGRLFAEYEALQWVAARASGTGRVSASIANRYYGIASTCPAIAFPTLEIFAKTHLRELRRRNPSSAIAMEQRLQGIGCVLEQSTQLKFPSILSLIDQGRFALGYYHQRSHSLAQARPRRYGGMKKSRKE
jgi:CRISPR-associated protein Csd1